MEYILNSYDHKVSDNCLRFNFKNQYDLIIKKYHLWKYYNYFENVSNKFNIGIEYKNKLILIQL